MQSIDWDALWGTTKRSNFPSWFYILVKLISAPAFNSRSIQDATVAPGRVRRSSVSNERYQRRTRSRSVFQVFRRFSTHGRWKISLTMEKRVGFCQSEHSKLPPSVRKETMLPWSACLASSPARYQPARQPNCRDGCAQSLGLLIVPFGPRNNGYQSGDAKNEALQIQQGRRSLKNPVPTTQNTT